MEKATTKTLLYLGKEEESQGDDLKQYSGRCKTFQSQSKL